MSVERSHAIEFPKHDCSLKLEHNPHCYFYLSAGDWIAEEDGKCDEAMYVWRDELSKQRSIDSNEIWTLQWYPDTSDTFFAIAAPTLSELLEFASE